MGQKTDGGERYGLTPFGGDPLEQQLVRIGFWPFALYQRFALQRERPEESRQA